MPTRPVTDYFNALPIDPRRRVAPATARNRDPILAVLREHVPLPARVLELASGTGEHGAYFCTQLPELQWQPSDADPDSLASITAWTEALRLSNLHEPVAIDLSQPVDHLPWSAGIFDAGFCANLIHIAPWEVCPNMLSVMSRVLKPNAPFIVYGPFRVNGAHTAPSNVQFEQWLHSLDPRFGVRDREAVVREADVRGLDLEQSVEMPANNFCLVFRKRAAGDGIYFDDSRRGRSATDGE